MKEIKKTAKYIVLLGILYLTYELIVQNEDGYGFGIIALICWALAFLDLARIKLGDYEIDFMNKADVLTAEEKKKIEENYSAVKSFLANFYETKEVSDDELKNLASAKQQAELYLPKDIVTYITELYNKSLELNIDQKIYDRTTNTNKRDELRPQIVSADSFLDKTKPEKVYRKFLKVGQDDKD